MKESNSSLPLLLKDLNVYDWVWATFVEYNLSHMQDLANIEEDKLREQLEEFGLEDHHIKAIVSAVFSNEANGVAEDLTSDFDKPPQSILRYDFKDYKPEEFHDNFVVPGIPVVLSNAQEILPMHLTTDYMNEKYGDRRVPLEVNTSKQKVVYLQDYLKFQDKDLSMLYLRNLQMAEWFPQELEKFSLPPHFGLDLLKDPSFAGPCVPTSWRNWFEFFICTTECRGFPFCHQDTCNTHAFFLQIQGQKEIIAFPPSDSDYLYPIEPSRKRSMVDDVFQPNLHRYPLMKKATRHLVTLEPGDIMFLPMNWWHSARCVSPSSPSVSVAGNFVVESNAKDFLDSFCDYQAALSLIKNAAGYIN